MLTSISSLLWTSRWGGFSVTVVLLGSFLTRWTWADMTDASFFGSQLCYRVVCRLAALCSSAGRLAHTAVLPIAGVSWQNLFAFLVQRNRAVRKQRKHYRSWLVHSVCQLCASALQAEAERCFFIRRRRCPSSYVDNSSVLQL